MGLSPVGAVEPGVGVRNPRCPASGEPLHVTVLGLGWVGSTMVSRLLAHAGRPLVINIAVPSRRHHGAYLDLAHTASLHPLHELRWNDAAVFRKSRFVFHAAGVSNPHGVSRLSVAATNAAITREVFGAARFADDPFVIVITNPVDVIAWHVWRAGGVDAGRVISTGTLLEAVRLAFYLGKALGVRPHHVDAWVVGEHGEAQVALFSHTTVDHQPVRALVPDEASLEAAADATRTAAWQIRETQPSTWWGVTDCAYAIFCGLLGEADRCCPVGIRVSGEWAAALGVADIFLGLPAQLSAGRCTPIDVEAFGPLTDTEWAGLRRAAEIVARATFG